MRGGGIVFRRGGHGFGVRIPKVGAGGRAGPDLIDDDRVVDVLEGLGAQGIEI